MKIVRVRDKLLEKEGVLTEEQWNNNNNILFITCSSGPGFISKRENLEILNDGEIEKDNPDYSFEDPSYKVSNIKNGNIGYVDKKDWDDKNKKILFREKIDEFEKTDLEEFIQIDEERHGYIVDKKYLLRI